MTHTLKEALRTWSERFVWDEAKECLACFTTEQLIQFLYENDWFAETEEMVIAEAFPEENLSTEVITDEDQANLFGEFPTDLGPLDEYGKP